MKKITFKFHIIKGELINFLKLELLNTYFAVKKYELQIE